MDTSNKLVCIAPDDGEWALVKREYPGPKFQEIVTATGVNVYAPGREGYYLKEWKITDNHGNRVSYSTRWFIPLSQALKEQQEEILSKISKEIEKETTTPQLV